MTAITWVFFFFIVMLTRDESQRRVKNVIARALPIRKELYSAIILTLTWIRAKKKYIFVSPFSWECHRLTRQGRPTFFFFLISIYLFIFKHSRLNILTISMKKKHSYLCIAISSSFFTSWILIVSIQTEFLGDLAEQWCCRCIHLQFIDITSASIETTQKPSNDQL